MNRDNRRLRLIFALLIVTSLTLLTLDLRGGKGGAFGAVRNALGTAFSPIQHGLSHLFTPVGDAFEAALHAKRDQNTIDSLQRRLAALQLERDKDATVKADTPLLLRLGQLNYETKTKGVAGSVIAHGGAVDNFESTVTLDIGSVDHVQDGLPVIDSTGLIGRVVRVTAHSCIVLLIDDKQSSVEVDLGAGATSLIANVSGQGPGQPLYYDQIEPAKFRPTSGTTLFTVESSSYLKGIPVGKVSGVTLSGTDEVGLLTPVADLNSRVVEVVLSQQTDAPREPLVPQSPPPIPAAIITPSTGASAPSGSATPGTSATPSSSGPPAVGIQTQPVFLAPSTPSPSTNAPSTSAPSTSASPTARSSPKPTASPTARSSSKPTAKSSATPKPRKSAKK